MERKSLQIWKKEKWHHRESNPGCLSIFQNFSGIWPLGQQPFLYTKVSPSIYTPEKCQFSKKIWKNAKKSTFFEIFFPNFPKNFQNFPFFKKISKIYQKYPKFIKNFPNFHFFKIISKIFIFFKIISKNFLKNQKIFEKSPKNSEISKNFWYFCENVKIFTFSQRIYYI